VAVISSEKISHRYLEINRCGIQRLSGKEIRILRREGRVDWYILYVMKGQVRVTEGARELLAGEDDMILYRPCERQEYAISERDDTLTCYIHFSGTACEALMTRFGLSGRITHLSNGAALRVVLEEMVEEFLLQKPHSAELSAALLVQFLSLAGRACSEAQSTVSAALQKSIDTVRKHMHEHGQENRTVREYAEMCHLSEGRFAHVFKESTGMSPKQYMLHIKTELACRLLATTDLSVGEVAREVGIEDPNYFCRLMKKQTGHTPKALR